MDTSNLAINAAYLTIKRLKGTVKSGHIDDSEFSQAWKLIYAHCYRVLASKAGCRCGGEKRCSHEIDEMVELSIVAFNKALEKDRIKRPASARAYLNRICLNVYIRESNRIRNSKIQNVEYTEMIENDEEGMPINHCGEISKTVADRQLRRPPRWRDILLDSLLQKKFSMREAKIFLRFYFEHKTLSELASFYRTNLPEIFRAKTHVVAIFKDDLSSP